MLRRRKKITCKYFSPTASDLNLKYGAAFFHKCDVSKQTEVASLIEKIKLLNNGIEILINNAGIGFVGNVENTTEADFDRLYSVNVKGVYNCIKAVIPIFQIL